MMGRAAQTPGLAQVFSLFETSTPQLYLDIDRTKAQLLGVNVSDVFTALQTYIGSSYVNDFNLFGRTFRVVAQADSEDRLDPKDVLKIRVRNASGETVPLGSFTTVQRPLRAVSGAALQPLSGGRARRRRGARLLAGPGDRDHGEARRRDAAGRLQLRMDDARLPAAARRQHGDLRVRAGGRVRVPGAGRAIREPDAAARRHPDRADVPGRGDHRRGAARPGQQHPHPGGLHRADRACGQERHSDRRIRQAARGSGTRRASRRRSRQRACGCGRS